MRVAVFVDAGYVYAQGSCALTGLKTPKSRDKLSLDESQIAELLKQEAKASSDGKELLRIYWYDGAPASGPSLEQGRMGKLNDVKLRLGQLNSEGQQKGVDSLIVTDLMELASNKAISDAVIVTGDEDIRVGVQIAQSLGVRVHLLGFVGPKGSQSISLQQEADTLEIWDKPKIASFLRDTDAKPEKVHRSPKAEARSRGSTAKPVSAAPARATHVDGAEISNAVQKAFDDLKLDHEKFAKTTAAMSGGERLPSHIATDLNAGLKSRLKRNPTKPEFKDAKEALSKKLREAR
ncbi:MAG: NYN domain-containing protein [Aestuariivirga sp.]